MEKMDEEERSESVEKSGGKRGISRRGEEEWLKGKGKTRVGRWMN